MEAIHERQRGVWVLRIIMIKNAVEGKAAEGGRSRVQTTINKIILGAAALEAVLTRI
ncbi:hypothetical protein L211DRAFT_832792 [Terfezia boudieri ATCC MYA-4762]|uniref:Uncharacterized protein n=1 Tax=Terfezia boudieri ATCC MYA-4762 TaxID=1051890 RepID=A0A3N4ML27_9PEZI|nr:hypothetical protein L211DRAFT_832792 [Terfezia boudieri ATCC MYA-4762]